MSKRTLHALIINCFLISTIYAGGLNAQQIKSVKEASIKIKLENANLVRVFHDIEAKTDYEFTYKSEDLDQNFRFTGKFNNATVAEVLLEISKQTDLKFKQVNNNIHISKKSETARNEQILEVIIQGITITGKLISSEDNQGLPGAAIAEKGTSNGTITDLGGNYQLTVTEGAVLVISYVGYITQEIAIGNRTVIDVTLVQDIASLSEIVVTALGIGREKNELGYSVGKVDDFNNTGVYNVANTLSGKVAGVNISQVASGAGGSSKIIIRGNNSLRGDSQPLIIVDGVPMNNQTFGNVAGRWGGVDYGDGLTSINQDDIETITVLKGPNAAALYGERGANGVILITSKSGTARKGIGVQLNSSFSFGNAAVLPDFQDVYGQGLNNQFTHIRSDADDLFYSWADAQANGITGMRKMSAGRNRLTRGSWGAKFDGQPHEDQFGNVLPYDPQPNTFQNFFNTEKRMKNGITLTGGSENVNYFFSFSNMHVDGYVPKNTTDRNTFNLRTIGKITPNIEVDFKINYSIEENENRPYLSDGTNNPVYLIISRPRGMHASSLEDYMWTEESVSRALGVGSRAKPGNEKTYATNGSTANPYWTLDRTGNNDRRDRVLGSVNLKYNITKGLNLNLRGGTDMFTKSRFHYRAIGTRRTSNQRGDMWEYVSRVREDNYDALLSYDLDLGKDIKVIVSAGGSQVYRFYKEMGQVGQRFLVPDLYAINNTETQTTSSSLRESKMVSVYGMANFGFKNYLFLDVTGRNDWSSTLPLTDNSFFYPSVGASFVLSEAFDISSNSLLSYLKIRGSLAQAGSSGSPYQLFGAYSLNGIGYVGQPYASYSSTLNDPNLQNEMTTSFEFGVDMRLLQDRVSMDLTYYSASTVNQILTIPISRTAGGFTSMRINAGELTNKGIELLIGATPIESTNFTWNMSFNFAKNVNEVISLAEGIDVYQLGEDRNGRVLAVPGEQFAQIYGTSFSWLKDENGNRLVYPVGTNPDTGLPYPAGVPIRSEGKIVHHIGSALPDWTGGFTNALRYKGISLSALIDIRQGGKILSQTTRETILYGTTKKTLPGRDGTYVAEGVVAQLNGDGDWVSTGVTNTQQVMAQDYWGAVADKKDNTVSEELLNDASYISMREIVLSYRLSSDLISKTPFRNIELGLFGRNLFYFQRNTDGFAPEASAFNANNSGIGFESTSLPLLRTFGINLKVEL